MTPRGVLKNIYDRIIWGLGSTGENDLKTAISDNSTGDFAWFFQPGKVYSDSDKSYFTKYTNLHLGMAYDVMTAKEYYELSGNGKSANKYEKP